MLNGISMECTETKFACCLNLIFSLPHVMSNIVRWIATKVAIATTAHTHTPFSQRSICTPMLRHAHRRLEWSQMEKWRALPLRGCYYLFVETWSYRAAWLLLYAYALLCFALTCFAVCACIDCLSLEQQKMLFLTISLSLSLSHSHSRFLSARGHIAQRANITLSCILTLCGTDLMMIYGKYLYGNCNETPRIDLRMANWVCE